VLDWNMPERDGVTLCHDLRRTESLSGMYVILLTGNQDKKDVIVGLESGADDYITKPVAVDELLARIRALSRRSPASSDSPVVRLGPTEIDLASRVVRRRGPNGEELVRLTPTEWRMLEVLARESGRLVPSQQLLTEVWGPQYTNDTGYLRLYVSQLRKKLEPLPSAPRHILTEPGMGYRFVPDEPE
jgi:two-component system KDP operon response regulator KdpE